MVVNSADVVLKDPTTENSGAMPTMDNVSVNLMLEVVNAIDVFLGSMVILIVILVNVTTMEQLKLFVTKIQLNVSVRKMLVERLVIRVLLAHSSSVLLTLMVVLTVSVSELPTDVFPQTSLST